jgi:Holliday junction resolvasome RuvABC ATP-dependent DNA helicase subunit
VPNSLLGALSSRIPVLLHVCLRNSGIHRIGHDRSLNGLEAHPIFMNRMFVGNQGTGKTTCAKLYGQLLKNLNLLSNGNVVMTTASDFIGGHMGESPNKTNAILSKSIGKVLMIDEAYILSSSAFGKEVLDTIVEKVQGTSGDDIAVLLIGYEKQMLEMIKTQNPGLARRFPIDQSFKFQDYTDDELLQILNQTCMLKNIKASWVVCEKILRKVVLERAYPNFGNASTLKLLLNAASAKASTRKQSSIAFTELIVQDVETGHFDNHDPFEPLDKLFNIDNIKNDLMAINNAFVVAKKEGTKLPEVGHFVFRGSPGTGKTTVARVMAQILFQVSFSSYLIAGAYQ